MNKKFDPEMIVAAGKVVTTLRELSPQERHRVLRAVKALLGLDEEDEIRSPHTRPGRSVTHRD